MVHSSEPKKNARLPVDKSSGKVVPNFLLAILSRYPSSQLISILAVELRNLAPSAGGYLTSERYCYLHIWLFDVGWLVGWNIA